MEGAFASFSPPSTPGEKPISSCLRFDEVIGVLGGAAGKESADAPRFRSFWISLVLIKDFPPVELELLTVLVLAGVAAFLTVSFGFTGFFVCVDPGASIGLNPLLVNVAHKTNQ